MNPGDDGREQALQRISSVWGPPAAQPSGRNVTIRTARIAATQVPDGVRLLRRQISGGEDADYRPAGWKLGEGGMGQVIVAEQTVLGRDVAVKRLHPDRAADPDARANFLAEAAVTADLEHPNIIPIHDLGIDERGIPFYAMKLAAGTTWDACLEQLSLTENIDILLKVCDAVAYAHSKGVIHRDLKPENVMIGEYGEVLVLDWGLAAAVGEGTRAPPIRSSASISGTPAFMPPEVALGLRGEIGKASDIYLLGALLYNLITGHPPHEGTDIHELLLAASRNEIAPIAGGGDLDAIARQALHAEPGQRHATVEEFADAIRQWRQHHASIRLGRNAGRDLERARNGGSYDSFAQAAFAFREALRLWPGNAVAAVGLSATGQTWATAALGRGDLDLAAAQIDLRDPDHRAIAGRIAAERMRRQRHHLRSRILQGAVVALVVALPLVLLGWTGLSWWQHLRMNTAEQVLDADQGRLAIATKAATRTVDRDREQAHRRALAFVPYAEAQDLLLRGQLPRRAAELLREAAALDPTSPETLFALGEALRSAGQPQQAGVPFLAADTASRTGGGGGYPLALLHAAIAALHAGDHAATVEALRAVIVIAGTSSFGRTATAWSMALAGQPEAAVPAACQTAAEAPKTWECQLIAGLVCQAAADSGATDPAPLHARALGLLRQAGELAPHEVAIHELLADEFAWDGGADGQRGRDQHLAWLDARSAADPVCALAIISRLAIAGRPDEAANRLARLDRANLPPHRLGLAELDLAAADGDAKEVEAAARNLVTAAALAPQLTRRLVRIVVDAPELQPAIQAALRGRAPSTGIVEALRLGDDPGAEEVLRSGLAARPWHADMLALLAGRLESRGRWAELEPVARRASACRPGEGRPRLQLAKALIGLQRHGEAIIALADAQRVQPRLSAEVARLLSTIPR